MKKLTALIVLDGFGCTKEVFGNAIAAADLTYIPKLLESYPNTFIAASGVDVGLPEGQMGNSEVGHMNLGAGRIVPQELLFINEHIEKGSFFENKAFLGAIKNCKENDSALHIFGLLSDGGVHSHINHLFALIDLATQHNIKKLIIHCFLDGRDTAPNSGIDFIDELQSKLNSVNNGKIASVMGRFFAMDRDNNFTRVQKAYDALVFGVGNEFSSAHEAVFSSYSEGIFDEYVVPAVIVENGAPVATIEKQDSVIFYNFRPDRAYQLAKTLLVSDEEFGVENFHRKENCFPYFASMSPYKGSIDSHMNIAFDRKSLEGTLGEYISKLGLTQLRIAETEKFAHVTKFFNGNSETQFLGEDRALIPSPKVEKYSQKPAMSAYEVAEECVKRIESGKYDFIVLNFANPDMVGHTGDFDATVEAVKVVDECLKRVVETILAQNGRAIITADHGNAEKMIDRLTRKPLTEHTTSKVMLIVADNEKNNIGLRENGKLCDVAPTLLQLMNIEKPEIMTGISLIME
ncbi:MAG: 2,3-bisphosphoglycerate-independent phosphoglycerate mutase [Clostridiales bacterium]|nr:2,3-bisphosphoglycerate-independent phosphoglycerate mutase [Clostridiales bacterium]